MEKPMIKHLFAISALGGALLTSAVAQDAKPFPAGEAEKVMPQLSEVQGPVRFVPTQASTEWRASKIVGAPVYSTDNRKIGDVNDLLLAPAGGIHAAVIGVGGFLGVGEKNVAVPFAALQITRRANSDAVERITINLTQQQLQDAPRFSYLGPDGRQTTGAADGERAVPVIDKKQ
ncbi:MAG: PRC-barrel domain-containing protein [Pseudolabrys sp.]|nr:PRC-barrel domain-containing protein [Pseudolabrys sp.]